MPTPLVGAPTEVLEVAEPAVAPRFSPVVRRWGRFGVRLLLLLACGWAAASLPLPLLDEWLPLRGLLTTVLTVVLAGKLLFDTLFYDRFWP